MKIFIKAKPNSKIQGVEKIDNEHFVVLVQEPPRGGRANVAIRKALAEYFNIPVSSVTLVSGFSSKQKIFEIFN